MENIPKISSAHRVCIICEGAEDTSYINRISSLSVWSPNYKIVTVDAKGASKIPARYQNIYSLDSYELVLIFCDTDKYPHTEYKRLTEKINNFHGKNVSKYIVIYSNPCTMQIILSHFGQVELRTQNKQINSEIIKDLTGVDNYDAHTDQINQICSQIYKRTYADMKERVSEINKNFEVTPSTNFIDFIKNFENDDALWIKEINDLLESDEMP